MQLRRNVCLKQKALDVEISYARATPKRLLGFRSKRGRKED